MNAARDPEALPVAGSSTMPQSLANMREVAPSSVGVKTKRRVSSASFTEAPGEELSEPRGGSIAWLVIAGVLEVRQQVQETDTDEGLTAEMLGATQVLEYESLAERANELRPTIRAIGIKRVAKAVELSDRALRAIANQDVSPRKSTIEKLDAALKGSQRKPDRH
jgi:hypothetical protein